MTEEDSAIVRNFTEATSLVVVSALQAGKPLAFAGLMDNDGTGDLGACVVVALNPSIARKLRRWCASQGNYAEQKVNHESN